MKKTLYTLLLLCVASLAVKAYDGDGGQISAFPKMREVHTVVYQGIGDENSQSDLVCRVLQGIVNRDSAELFLSDDNHDVQWFKYIGKPYRRVAKRYTSGSYRSLRNLFGEYRDRIEKLVVCDFKTNSYTWNMAVMMACKENALPVSEEIKDVLLKEFDWKGEVVDIRQRWSSAKEAYTWAIDELMPSLNHQVVFSAGLRDDWASGEWKIFDYAVATRSVCFWLDNHTQEGTALIQKILRQGGYPQNAPVMGYGMHGDDLNDVTNPEGFGYVVGDFIPNVSFYSSLPTQSFARKQPQAVKAEPQKIYVALHFSDGDNIMFDHNLGYDIYNSEARGQTPVTMTLAPALTELAPFILRYYTEHLTGNDELMGGPSGFQYIQEPFYRATDYVAWNKKNAQWLRQAGFTATASSLRWPAQPFFNNGFLHSDVVGTLAWSNGDYHDAYDWFGMPVVVTGGVTSDVDGMYRYLTSIQPSDQAPKFTGIYMVQAGFGTKGYQAANELRQRLEAEHPGRYVFLKASDLLATAKEWMASRRSAYGANDIPGQLEAEDFDGGGENIGYYTGDSQTYNSSYRADAANVDIVDLDDGYGVRGRQNGWMSYTVNIADKGSYRMSVMAQIPNTGEAASVMLDGQYLGTIDAEGGQGMSPYSFEVNLPESGRHELRLWFAQTGVVVDKIVFERSDASPMSPSEDKSYSIIAKHSGKCIAPISSGYVDGTNIVQKTPGADGADALWRVAERDGGYWNLSPSGTDKCMTCRAGKYIQLFDYNNASALQSWTLRFVDDTHFTIGAKGTGMVIEVKDGSLGENVSLALASYTGSDNQLFSLKESGTETSVTGNSLDTRVWLSDNPFKDKVLIRMPVTSDELSARLDIYAASGARVYSEVAPVSGASCCFCWQPHNASHGVYIYNVRAGKVSASGKLVKI